MINPFEASVIENMVGPSRQRAASEAYHRRVALEARRSATASGGLLSLRRAIGVSVIRAGARLAGCSYQLEMSSQS